MRLVRFVKAKESSSSSYSVECYVNPEQVVALTKWRGSETVTVIWLPASEDSLEVSGSLAEVAALLMETEVQDEPEAGA